MADSNKSNEIEIIVGLDEENVPESIHWKASDDPSGAKDNTARAMLLSFLDNESMDTLKIDIWTKELMTNEMDRFMYQTLRGLADTYHRSTGNKKLASDMQRFVQYFAEETGIIERDST